LEQQLNALILEALHIKMGLEEHEGLLSDSRQAELMGGEDPNRQIKHTQNKFNRTHLELLKFKSLRIPASPEEFEQMRLAQDKHRRLTSQRDMVFEDELAACFRGLHEEKEHARGLVEKIKHLSVLGWLESQKVETK
jgi:hypothetical protein